MKPEASSIHRHYPAHHRYRGQRAAEYDTERTTSRRQRRKWNAELGAVERLLRAAPAGSAVIDLPCGTGRLVPLFARHGLRWVGGDVSYDMIRQAQRKAAGPDSRGELVLCDGEQLPFDDRAFEVAICLRLLNLVPPETAAAVVGELCRISRRGLIVEIRLRGEVPLLDLLLRRLRTALARELTGRFERPSSRRLVSPAYPRPTSSWFRALCERLDLELKSSYAIGWPRWALQPDPLRIFYLERRQTGSEQQ